MIIQPNNIFPTTTSSFKFQNSQIVSANRVEKDSDTVTISKAAQAAFAATQNSVSSANSSAANSVDARLAEIKSKDIVSRTASDTEYLWANDKKLAEIAAKGKSPDNLTSSELDYMQKAGGFVNTMANLSPAEKDLYDKAVASGNKEAAAGISQIAFIRTMGHTAGGANGTSYDPINTEITAANIERYFSHSIVDPSGKAQSQFQALIQYLQNNPASS
ncbi:MAG: hypothetical protein Q7J38_06135 [Gallionella sp.]|nr:hypothetical protein [Gallionella sp.]